MNHIWEGSLTEKVFPGKESRTEGLSPDAEDPFRDSVEDTYIIEGQIGAGSGGIVYKAYHKRLKKPLVLKKIKIPHQNIEENRREADILKQLRHSYLPGVLDFITIAGDIYTVMDFIDGDTLSDCLSGGRLFTQNEAVKYSCQLLEALKYLHEQPIPVLHGDIKPSNIMLTKAGNICLIDFNISGYLMNGCVPVNGYSKGFASPEQEQAIQEAIMRGGFVRPGAIDERSDLYSAGAILFVLLTGKNPERDEMWLQEEMEAQGISDGIIHVVLKALNENPDNRYASADQMLSDLKDYRKLEHRYKVEKRCRIAASVLVAGVLIAIVVMAGSYVKIRSKEKEQIYQENLLAMESQANDVKNDGQRENIGEQGSESENDYHRMIEYYEQCIKLFPERCAPKVEMARFLYNSGKYEECRKFVRESLTQETDAAAAGEEATAYGKLYYLLGNCYEHADSLEEAIQAYEFAIKMDESNPDYFRDYAIALVRNGKKAQAEDVLEEAEEKGLMESQISLVRGEIYLEQGSYEEAVEAFKSCLTGTEGEGDRLRAYLLISKAYEMAGITRENMLETVSILEEARRSISLDRRAPVLECLAQAYIHLLDLTGDLEYADKGVSVFQEIIQDGWSDAQTYNNIIVLLQREGDLEQAEKYAEEMLRLYPDDYRSYKRSAFIENARQESLDPESRDYRRFVSYYQKADTLLGQVSLEQEDVEMRILQNAYMQLVSKGWVSE